MRKTRLLVPLAWCLGCAPTAPAREAATTPKPAPVPLAAAAATPAVSASAAPIVPAAEPSAALSASAAESARAPAPPPHFVGRLAHVRGRVVYQGGSPAAHLPVAIENGCETLASFTDERGRFAFDDVALPARFRALERFRLWRGGNAQELTDEIPLAATAVMPTVTIESKAVTYLEHSPATRAAIDFMNTIDLWGAGLDPGSVIVAARPPQVAIARKVGFTVAVLDGDANRYIAEAHATPPEAWVETVRARLAAARAAWELAELGASRKPRSRVREDTGCIERASAPQAP